MLVILRYKIAYVQVHRLVRAFQLLCWKLLLEGRLYQYLQFVVFILHRPEGVSPGYVFLLLLLIGLADMKVLLFVSVYSSVPKYPLDYHFSRF